MHLSRAEIDRLSALSRSIMLDAVTEELIDILGSAGITNGQVRAYAAESEETLNILRNLTRQETLYLLAIGLTKGVPLEKTEEYQQCRDKDGWPMRPKWLGSRCERLVRASASSS